jgi:hypothetical protein
MNCLLKAGVVAFSLVALWTTNAEACGRIKRHHCQLPGCQAMCCQAVSRACPALVRRPTTESDCLDDNGNKLQKGWYWQAYYFSTSKIYKIGPFVDEATCKRNMDMTCPSSDCCPAKDPYYCPGVNVVK